MREKQRTLLSIPPPDARGHLHLLPTQRLSSHTGCNGWGFYPDDLTAILTCYHQLFDTFSYRSMPWGQDREADRPAQCFEGRYSGLNRRGQQAEDHGDLLPLHLIAELSSGVNDANTNNNMSRQSSMPAKEGYCRRYRDDRGSSDSCLAQATGVFPSAIWDTGKFNTQDSVRRPTDMENLA
jgi:hypothetical protein